MNTQIIPINTLLQAMFNAGMERRVWRISTLLYLLKNTEITSPVYNSILTKVSDISNNIQVNQEWVSNINRLNSDGVIKATDYIVNIGFLPAHHLNDNECSVSNIAILLFSKIGDIEVLSPVDFNVEKAIITTAFGSNKSNVLNLLALALEQKTSKHILSSEESSVLYNELVGIFNQL